MVAVLYIIRYFETIIMAAPFACALIFFIDWQHDRAILHQQAIVVTRNLETESERIRAVNDWVYHNQGFGKNKRFFLASALGPTPVQILESGGDCADKSRLVAAMLNELHIEAGLIMISPCEHCAPIHTVVEARYENGRMVVDPVWDIDYPAADGGYLGVRDLAGTKFGRERLIELQAQRGATDKIAAMPATEATFDYAAAINWNKNAATAAVARGLRSLGYAPETMFRPRFFEDPKLALTLICVFIGMAAIVVRLVLRTGGDIARTIVRKPIRLDA